MKILIHTAALKVAERVCGPYSRKLAYDELMSLAVLSTDRLLEMRGRRREHIRNLSVLPFGLFEPV
jgi:hypothetical protein